MERMAGTRGFRLIQGLREKSRQWRAELTAWEAEHPALSAAWDDALAVDAQRTEAQRAARREVMRLHSAGVPHVAAQRVVTGLDDTPSVAFTRTWHASGRTFLLLFGGPGTGKTMAAAWACHQRRGALFTRALDACALGLFTPEGMATMERLRSADFLVLDDMGAEFMSDVWRAQLDALIDVRYSERRGTIITSNLDAAKFRERYGERIADRLRHDGMMFRSCDASMRTGKSG